MKLREEKKPLITIPLDLPGVRVLETEVATSGEFVITVESTMGGTTCRKCGRETTQFHWYDRSIRLRHLPILDRPVWTEAAAEAVSVSLVFGPSDDDATAELVRAGGGQDHRLRAVSAGAVDQ